MPDPHWTSYVGMATGIIGALTGIAGAVMGTLGYRKSNEIKSLDLRLELRKALSDLHMGLSKLEELLPLENQSRQRVAAATGKIGSGAMVIWDRQYEEDQLRLSNLAKEAPGSDIAYDDLKPKELEETLVDMHKLQSQVNHLVDKYNSAFKSDDEERKQIREDAMRRGGSNN